MSLDVDTPEPPELSHTIDADEYDDVEVQGDDYRREELEQFLSDGAWEEAFTQWAAETSVDELEFGIIQDRGLIQEFDFFWDFNQTTQIIFHSKSGKSSGASYSVSQST